MQEAVSKKSVVASIIAFLVILLLVYYGALQQEKALQSTPVDTVEDISTTITIDVASQGDKLVIEDESEWLVSHIEYPSLNTEIKDWILAKSRDFEVMAKDDHESMSIFANENPDLGMSAWKYEWNASYTLTENSNYLSYVYTVYSFTGGAHGALVYDPYIIDKKTGARVESLDELYTQSVHVFLQDFSRNDLRKQFARKQIPVGMLQEDVFREGTTADSVNYSVFWFDGDALVVHFSDYQIGPHALGQYDVSIPLSQLERFKKER